MYFFHILLGYKVDKTRTKINKSGKKCFLYGGKKVFAIV